MLLGFENKIKASVEMLFCKTWPGACGLLIEQSRI